MNGGHWMVVLIVLIAVSGGIIRARLGLGRDRSKHRQDFKEDGTAVAENYRLKSEIAQMKERIQVLERVVTDTEGSVRLDREIEKLRAPSQD